MTSDWVTIKIPREQFNMLKSYAETKEAKKKGITSAADALRRIVGDAFKVPELTSTYDPQFIPSPPPSGAKE